MDDRDPGAPSDGTELVASMGWEPLPYGCVGMARKREMGGSKVVWSWLVLIPWAVNDTKPWIDGTELMEDALLTEAEQKDQVFAKVREILDERYGETVGKQAAEELIRRLQEED